MSTSAAGRVGRAVVANVSVNGAVGGLTGGVSYSIYHKGDWSWRAFSGSVAGGGVASGVGGIAGPAGGTIAQTIGRTSTSAAARVTTAAIGSGGGIIGGALNNDIAGAQTTGADLLWSGTTGALGTQIPGGPTQSRTLNEFGRFNPSTASGVFGASGNAERLWRSSLVGGAVGVGLDGAHEALKEIGIG